ncbi:hypothetical protein SAMN02983003_1041 [Devosia enhydra]|uniref:Sporulation related domain-containing protein n=1 Tax=Devosia enhydra TaxID=665118 RepID=A0A1K2HUZ5_9HYPH|nr:SPOR domain-containing protein [Devosia enhydra]SFZ82374.1 hypothetical protein SAMN02983003_1041 [Devosia enhydra]
MADQADKSDDLIAELARLMASTAPASDEKAPSTTKVTPPPAPAAPSRIRIPGMDTPVDVPAAPPKAAASPKPVGQAPAPQSAPVNPAPAQQRPATPTIRIPGMDQPLAVGPAPKPAIDASASARPPAEKLAAEKPPTVAPAAPRVGEMPTQKAAAPLVQAPSVAPAQPQASKFDFGALPDLKPVVNTEPLSVLQKKQASPEAQVQSSSAEATVEPKPEARDTAPMLRPSVHPEGQAAETARPAPAVSPDAPPQQSRFEPRIPGGPSIAARPDALPVEPVKPEPTPVADELPAFTRAEAREPGPLRFESPKVEAPRIEIPAISVAKSEQSRPEPQRAAASEPQRRIEPTLDIGSEPRRAPNPQPASGAPSTAGDFDFDFGFGSGTPQVSGQGPATAKSAEADAGSNVLDPIAALIRADLDAADARAAAAPLPRVNLDSIEQRQPPVQRANPVPPSMLQSMRGPSPARREPDADSFAVPPISPHHGHDRARAAADDFDDPMAEIESLIGEAVRVDLTPRDIVPPKPQATSAAPTGAVRQPPSQGAPAAPVVPPLGSQFPPRKSAIKEPDAGVEAAEQAILAAAAATGSEIGRVAAEAAPKEGKYRRERRQKAARSEGSGLRPFIGLALAGVLLVAASLGLYWVLNTGREDGAAPVLSADAGPAKVAAPATSTTTEQQSVVFNQLDGVTASGGEQLVPRDETNVADVIAEVPPSAAGEGGENELANRKVRTVTVRPDGTIVSSDDAVAGTSALPVDRPNVPQLPGGLAAQSELLAATENQPRTILPNASGATPAGSPPAGTLALGPSTAVPAVTPDAPVSINPEATLNTALVAPVPQPRLTNRESRLAALAAAQPASNPVTAVIGQPAAPAAAPAATVSSGGNANAYVQMMSLPTEGEARQQAGIIQSRWGSLFNGQGLVIQRAELNGGRVTYRVRLPANSLQSATQICAAIKSNGGDCFATNS